MIKWNNPCRGQQDNNRLTWIHSCLPGAQTCLGAPAWRCYTGGEFFCSSGGSFGTQDFPFLLHCIPGRKPARVSSHQELISSGTFRRAEVSLFHLLTAPSRSKTSWQGGGVSESPGESRSRKCSCQADPVWLLLDLGQMELGRS